MRKLLAICLLVLFAFNLGGYQLLYRHLADQADQALDRSIEWQQYQEDELITIKQPTDLPYYNSHRDFRPIQGEITLNGIHYRYVQYRIVNDSIELRCLPHHEKMRVKKAVQEYAGQVLDLQQDAGDKQPAGGTKKSISFLSEYEIIQSIQLERSESLLTTLFVLVDAVPGENGFVTTMEQPPDGRSFS